MRIQYGYDLDKLTPETLEEITREFEVTLERVLGRHTYAFDPDNNKTRARRRRYPSSQADAHELLCRVSAMPARNVFEMLIDWRGRLIVEQRERQDRANAVLSACASRAYNTEGRAQGFVSWDHWVGVTSHEFVREKDRAYRIEMTARLNGYTLVRQFDVPKENGIRAVKGFARVLARIMATVKLPNIETSGDDIDESGHPRRIR